VFWGEADEQPAREPRTDRRWGAPVLMIIPTAALALGSIGVSVFAGPLYGVAERAAADLLDEQVYVDAVLGDDDLDEARP
jgi:multicomponent Na+:H+ antiporter subunit D